MKVASSWTSEQAPIPQTDEKISSLYPILVLLRRDLGGGGRGGGGGGGGGMAVTAIATFARYIIFTLPLMHAQRGVK